MDLCREPYEELLELSEAKQRRTRVGVSSGHGLDLRLGLDPERPLDPVHVPFGLCRRRPDAEMRVANKREPLLVIGASSMYGPVPGTPALGCSSSGMEGGTG